MSYSDNWLWSKSILSLIFLIKKTVIWKYPWVSAYRVRVLEVTTARRSQRRARSSRFSWVSVESEKWLNSAQDERSPCSTRARPNPPRCRCASTDYLGTLNVQLGYCLSYGGGQNTRRLPLRGQDPWWEKTCYHRDHSGVAANTQILPYCSKRDGPNCNFDKGANLTPPQVERQWKSPS